MMVLVLHHREMEIKVITLPVLLEAIGITSLFPAHSAVVNHTTIYLHIKQFIGGSEPLKQSVSSIDNFKRLQVVVRSPFPRHSNCYRMTMQTII